MLRNLLRMQPLALATAVCLTLGLLPIGQATAATITSVGYLENGDGNPGHYGDNIAPEPDDCNLGSCAGITLYDGNDGLLAAPNGYAEWNSAAGSSHGATSFNADYDYYLSGQAGENAVFNANRHTALYYDPTIRWDITIAAGGAEPWELTLDLLNSGNISFLNGHSNGGSVFITGVSGSGLSGGSLSSGSLSFGSGASVASTSGAWNDAGAAVITGIGSTVVSFTLDFDIEAQIDGANYSLFSSRKGDCYAFGGGLSSQGATDCSATGSGLSVTGTLVTVPEPGTAMLVGGGLVLLAGMRRRAMRRAD
jgi:hypothetical protein